MTVEVYAPRRGDDRVVLQRSYSDPAQVAVVASLREGDACTYLDLASVSPTMVPELVAARVRERRAELDAPRIVLVLERVAEDHPYQTIPEDTGETQVVAPREMTAAEAVEVDFAIAEAAGWCFGRGYVVAHAEVLKCERCDRTSDRRVGLELPHRRV